MEPEHKMAYTEILRPNGDGDLVQCTAAYGSVLDVLTAPPVSPVNNHNYLIGVGATGAWTGYDNYLAQYQVGAWNIIYDTGSTINIASTGAKLYGSTATGWAPVTTDYYTRVNEDVGELGDITGIDTTRIASWGGDVISVGKLGPYPEEPTGIVLSQDILWSNYTGHASHRINYLTFRWAAIGTTLGVYGSDTYIYCDVYLSGVLVERINITAPRHGSMGEPDAYYGVRETEVVLDRSYTPAEIATLRTRLIGRSTDGFNLLAFECHTRTAEKEKVTELVGGSEKKIDVSTALEKPGP